ncbi:tetracycline resistance [Fusarium albosuccineum]|uniref:Tetracycline resistance n=1 Tax=Fusarium albosuccineum TaxID=1237068 RepID=A0A8H4P8P9_9HYPO|nr:tetracycline resistance [Fusarium albosuccineum]
MTQSKPAPIAIVGGGPCGLTFARLLESVGIEYVVFERDVSSKPTSREQGGTLDIHDGTGQEALRRAGVHAEFVKLARYDATVMTLMDPNGETRASFGDDRDAPEIDRLQLRQLLLDSLPSHRIRWGKTLRAVDRSDTEKQPGGGSWVLRFSDGTTESGFRLVVGADGAWSKLRQLITLAKPEYSGKMFIEGRVSPGNSQYETAREMAGKGTAMILSAKCTLCLQQMSDQSYRMYMGVVAPETLTRPGGDADPADMYKARATMLGPGGFYANWDPNTRAVIAASEGPWRPWPLYRLPMDLFEAEATKNCEETAQDQKSWGRAPGVVLLGDAAHLATPNGEGLGNGQAQGIHDEQADAAALERAVVAYEAEMRPRAREHIKSSIDLENLMYAEDGARRMIELFS